MMASGKPAGNIGKAHCADSFNTNFTYGLIRIISILHAFVKALWKILSHLLWDVN